LTINNTTSSEPTSREHLALIDRLYRTAVSADLSPRSQIAYGVYLAAHGQSIEALHEFSELACKDCCLSNTRFLNEIIQHVNEIENRLEQHEPTPSSVCRPGSAFDLRGTMRTHRPGDKRRQTGHLLLALARTSCEQGWGAIAVASLRKAIRCFESAARMKKMQQWC